MKVFRITADAKPLGSNAEHYAPLVSASKRDEAFLKWDDFSGRAFPRKWRRIGLCVSMPRLPRPDFYDFGTGVFVCSAKAAKLAGEPLGMCGELLPVKVQREKGNFFIYNVTNCINAVDQRKSQWETLLPGKRQLVKPAFVPDRLGELSIFKVVEDFGTNIYCLERSGNSDDGEFKAVVEHFGLTGLRFELIWKLKVGCLKSAKKHAVRLVPGQTVTDTLDIMTLGDVISNLGTYDESSFILVPANPPLSPETTAMVVPIPDDPGADLGIPGFSYLIEVYHAKDVLETWSSWRNSKTPTVAEAIEAIVFYQENDAYLPTEEMKRGLS